MPCRTVAASLTRMVIFIQATALRYDPHLDFECMFSCLVPCVLDVLVLQVTLEPLLTSSDLITASIYWSMIEVGLGYIATNSIVVYGLVAQFSFKSSLRSLRSLLSLPVFSRVSSQTDNNFHTGEEGAWPRDLGQHSTSAKYAGRDIEELPLNSSGINLKQEFGSTTEER